MFKKKNPAFTVVLLLFLAVLATGSIRAEKEPDKSPKDNMTSKIFRLSHRSPESMVGIIKIYLSKDGVYAVDKRTNALVIRDYPENIAKVARIIKEMDVPAPMVRVYVRFLGKTNTSSSGIYAGAFKRRGRWVYRVAPHISSSSGHKSGVMNLAVMSGSSGFIKVGKRTARPVRTWFYNYVRRLGYVTTGVVFEEVSTGFMVTPQVRGDNIHLSVAPAISYYDGKNRNRIKFREAETEVALKDGQTMVIGVSDSTKKGSHGLISRIVGYSSFKTDEVFSMSVTVKKIKGM